LEIEDGIYLIKNPHRTYFVSSVLIAGDRLTLIDAGRVESPDTSIYPFIKSMERDPDEIDLVVLTHAHWDHCAGVDQIRRDTGCEVAVHKNGESYLKDPETVARELRGRFPGVQLGNMADFSAIEPDILLTDGSSINLDGRELKVVHTPGHSACSCCIVETDLGLYIAGDSIQGCGEGRPLIFHDVKDYLASMERLLGEPVESIVNGHPFPPYGRAVLRGRECDRHIEESIEAEEQLMSVVLGVLEESSDPMSTMKVFETVNRASPFTVGCVLEALEVDGRVTREVAGGGVLWQR